MEDNHVLIIESLISRRKTAEINVPPSNAWARTVAFQLVSELIPVVSSLSAHQYFLTILSASSFNH
jgi:hypothetical protein